MKSLAYIESVAAVSDKLCPDALQPLQDFLTRGIYEGHIREIHNQLRFHLAPHYHGPAFFREYTDKSSFYEKPGRVRSVVNFHPQHGRILR